MAEHPAHTFSLGSISFTLNLHNGDYAFLPFNMQTGDALLEKALATPLCILHNEKPVYVFYRTAVSGTSENESLYHFKDGKWPSDVEILTLTREEAEHAYKILYKEKEYLVITHAALIEDDSGIYLYGGDDMAFTVSPPLQVLPVELKKRSVPEVTAKLVNTTETTKTYELTVGSWDGNDCYVSIYYNGNCARLYENGRLAADNLFCGKDIPFQFSMKHFISHSFRLEIDALHVTDDLYLEDRPLFEDGTACSLVKAVSEIEYKIRIL